MRSNPAGSNETTHLELQKLRAFPRVAIDKRATDAAWLSRRSRRGGWVVETAGPPAIASLYEAFPPERARRIVEKLEIYHTPKHGSWPNVVEIELSVLSRQCLDRRIGSHEELEREVAAWEEARNETRVGVRWRSTAKDARIKLHRVYPTL